MQPSLASAFNEDPIDPLQKLTMPILIVAGGRDLQLARVDMIALSTAAPQAQTAWEPEMNHVLVDVKDEPDNLAAYGQSDRPLDPNMIEEVAAFILESAAR
jgi:hypothetical protein